MNDENDLSIGLELLKARPLAMGCIITIKKHQIKHQMLFTEQKLSNVTGFKLKPPREVCVNKCNIS